MKLKTWFGEFTIDNGAILDGRPLIPEKKALVEYHLRNPDALWHGTEDIDLSELAVRSGFSGSKAEYELLLHDVRIEVVKNQIKASIGDECVIQSIEAIDDLNETSNILSERLAEWFGLHAPEINLKNENITEFVLRYEFEPGNSDNIMGADFSAGEIDALKGFAKSLSQLYASKAEIENYLSRKMAGIAPNLTDITGFILAARLLSTAGSMKKLAWMPASTIQVIGASNALFRHLRSKADPPKHGLIFRHPDINASPLRIRGKIARLLAATIAMAARIDYYSGRLNPDLKKRYREKLDRIKKMKAGINDRNDH